MSAWLNMNFREYIIESTKGLVVPKEFSAKQKAAIKSIKDSIETVKKRYHHGDDVSVINDLASSIDKKARKALSDDEFEDIYEFISNEVCK